MAASPDATAKSSSGPAVVDGRVLDYYAGAIGRAGLGELMETFVNDLPRMLDALRDAIATGDPDGVVRAAHPLKSSSEVVGATRLSELAGRMETQARDHRLDGATGFLDQIESLRGPVEAELRQLRERYV